MDSLTFRQTEFATSFGITLTQYRKLASSLNTEDVISCLELLKAKRCKSKFRSECQTQLRQWLEAGTELKPLSMTQLKAIAPKWPIKYRLPV